MFGLSGDLQTQFVTQMPIHRVFTENSITDGLPNPKRKPSPIGQNENYARPEAFFVSPATRIPITAPTAK